jgi:hypothetical protein
MEIYDNEILIDVSALNIDSASFRQLWTASEQNEDRLKEMVLGIVGERGKMQNPVTGSGGMLMGSIAKIGTALQDRKDIKLAIGLPPLFRFLSRLSTSKKSWQFILRPTVWISKGKPSSLKAVFTPNFQTTCPKPSPWQPSMLPARPRKQQTLSNQVTQC